MFSGHGSGTVRQWNLKDTSKPIKTLVVDYSVSAVAVIKSSLPSLPSLLAVAGQYNQLVLWDWQKNTAYHINYHYDPKRIGEPKFQSVFSRNDYINSLAINRNTLATADNQGFITLWDITKLYNSIDNCKKETKKQPKEKLICIPIKNVKEEKNKKDRNIFYALQNDNSQITNQWVAGQNQSIRSIALSKDTKSLFSVGEDGQVKIWCTSNPIEKTLEIAKFNSRLRTVDIKEENDKIIIASDAPENRVKIYEVNNNDCQ